MDDAPGRGVPWTITGWREGDAPELLALFNTGFGKSRSLTFWLWRFRDNPLGGPLASIARHDSDGRIVGSYLVIPCNLDLGGERVRAAQVVDLVVHPDYRRQGMFEAMARHSYAMLAELGYGALIAFPNPTAMSYPGFTRTLGWAPLCHTRRFTLLLDAERPAQRLLRLRPAALAANAAFRALRGAGLERQRRAAAVSGTQFRTFGALPEGYGPFREICRSARGPSFLKDAAYLHWRYDANPEHRFSYAGLTRGERLVALAVSLDRGGARMICELLAERGDASLARALVMELCREAFRARLRSLSYYGCDEPFLAAALRGFSRAGASENVLVAHPLAGGMVEAVMRREQPWALSYGDPDFF